MAQLPLAEQDTITYEHTTQGSGHAEDASYHNVCLELDSCFCCLADSEKLDLVEVVDTVVGMQVAGIEQRQCTDKVSMAY